MQEKSIPARILIAAYLAVTAAGAQSIVAFADNSEAAFWSDTGTISSPTAADPSAYPDAGEAGQIVHQVMSVEAMHNVSATRAQAERRAQAGDLAANPGNVWYVVRGSSVNGSYDRREFRPNDIRIVDGSGSEYRVSWATAEFQPQAMQLKNTPLEPGYIKYWLAFFELPEDSSGLQLHAGNLNHIAGQTVDFPLDTIQVPTQVSLGSIDHDILEFNRFDEIPADWTLPQYASRAKPTPAKQGHQWVVVAGRTLNTGQDARRLTAADYTVVDAGGESYRSVSPAYLYRTPESRIGNTWLEPDSSQDWRLFFEVPADIQAPSFRIGNLHRVRGQTVVIDLPDPAGLVQTAALETGGVAQ